MRFPHRVPDFRARMPIIKFFGDSTKQIESLEVNLKKNCLRKILDHMLAVFDAFMPQRSFERRQQSNLNRQSQANASKDF